MKMIRILVADIYSGTGDGNCSSLNHHWHITRYISEPWHDQASHRSIVFPSVFRRHWTWWMHCTGMKKFTISSSLNFCSFRQQLDRLNCHVRNRKSNLWQLNDPWRKVVTQISLHDGYQKVELLLKEFLIGLIVRNDLSASEFVCWFDGIRVLML